MAGPIFVYMLYGIFNTFYNFNCYNQVKIFFIPVFLSCLFELQDKFPLFYCSL